MDTSKNFFVGIEDSKDFRRNLLEASKNSVSILKHYHQINHLRKQKQKKIVELKDNLKEITMLITHLDDAMPDVGIRASPKKVVKNKRSQTQKLEEKKPVKKSELDILESQLKDIDSKLNNL